MQKAPQIWSAALCAALVWAVTAGPLCAGTVSSQGALEKMPMPFGDPKGYTLDGYYPKLRESFARAFDQDCIVNVVLVPSFVPEEAVAMRKTKSGYEVLFLKAKTAIWDTESIKDYEGGHITTFEEGRVVPLQENESYLDLKNRTPSDFRKIPILSQSRPLNKEIAERVARVWKGMIESATPTKPETGCDGEIYYFSRRTSAGKWKSAKVWSPDSATPAIKLVVLTWWLKDYAEGKCPAYELDRALRPFEASPAPLSSSISTKPSRPFKQ